MDQGHLHWSLKHGLVCCSIPVVKLVVFPLVSALVTYLRCHSEGFHWVQPYYFPDVSS